MLADKYATSVDQSLSGILLFGDVKPAAGELNFHGNAGANGLCAKIERSITGNNLGIGECADITHLGIVGSNLAGRDHLIELEPCSNTCQVTAFINGGKSIVEVGKSFGLCLHAGCVAELNLWESLSGLDHKVLMAKAVGKDYLASLVNQVGSLLIALIAFRNIGHDKHLVVFQTKSLLCGVHCVDEVFIIGGFLVVQANDTDLEVILICTSAGSKHEATCDHQDRHCQCNQFFEHVCSLQKNLFYIKGLCLSYHVNYPEPVFSKHQLLNLIPFFSSMESILASDSTRKPMARSLSPPPW